MIDLADLRRPSCYPDAPEDVEIVQTHISVVCLAGSSVYKLKKPVRLPFLDFSTAERREHFCREEVRLNRRLCPDVYRGVVALRRGPSGLNFRGEGEVLDHAVHMARLPADRMLDRLLREGGVGAADMRALARRIADFHAAADRGEAVRASGSPAGLAARMRANFVDTRTLVGPVFRPSLHEALAAQTERDLARLLPQLERRAEAGRVVDGHGDLHARNICMVRPPLAYDCIEFSDTFRCGDVAVENAFLTMDLRYRGHPELAAAYVEEYVAASGDREQPALLPALERYRAMVRAKVGAFASREDEIDPADRVAAAESARRHARLAAALAVEERGRWWIAIGGPPASGKSTVAAALQRDTGWPVLASDRIRKELAGVPPTERAPADAYTKEMSGRTYEAMIATATRTVGPVVLDANWPTRARRRALVDAATRAGAHVAFAVVTVGDAVAAARAARRAREPGAISDADATVARRLAATFEPPDDAEASIVVRMDGTTEPRALVDELLTSLVARGGSAR